MLQGDSNKAKRWFWIEFFIAFLLLVTSGFFTFLYYGANDQSVWKEGLISDKDQKIAELNKQIDTLNKEKEEINSTSAGEKGTLTEQNSALRSENDSLKAKIAKANAYNNFLKQLNSVVETHGGFSGWTDAEFQAALAVAQTTNDTDFINTVNWAWYETSINPTTRVITTWKKIASGIENSLK